MAELVKEEELLEWLDFKQRTPLMKTLRELRIPYVLGRGGRICTTLTAINASLLGTPNEQQEKSFEFLDD